MNMIFSINLIIIYYVLILPTTHSNSLITFGINEHHISSIPSYSDI